MFWSSHENGDLYLPKDSMGISFLSLSYSFLEFDLVKLLAVRNFSCSLLTGNAAYVFPLCDDNDEDYSVPFGEARMDQLKSK